jgi:6,7-dimethyl-8-ribityllumazine synthase
MHQTPVVEDLSSTRIAVISAAWHADLLAHARQGLQLELARQGMPSDNIDHFEVPGAFEIPLLAQRVARHGRHQAIVAIALVVDGGIYRHEFVASAVIDGLMRVQLDSGVPVLSCVLTPQAFHEHADHQRFYAEHLVGKGTQAAQAALQVLAAARQVDTRLAR